MAGLKNNVSAFSPNSPLLAPHIQPSKFWICGFPVSVPLSLVPSLAFPPSNFTPIQGPVQKGFIYETFPLSFQPKASSVFLLHPQRACSSRAAVILLSTLLVTHACSFTTFVWKPLAMGTYSNYSKTHIIPEITCAESRFTYELNLPGYFSFSEWVKYIVSTFMFSGSYFKGIIRVPSKVGKIDLAIFLLMDIHTCVNLM